jgi:hypothetical protein
MLLLMFAFLWMLHMLGFPVPLAYDVISAIAASIIFGFSWHTVLNMFIAHHFAPLLIGLPTLCVKELSAIMYLFLQDLILFQNIHCRNFILYTLNTYRVIIN